MRLALVLGVCLATAAWGQRSVRVGFDSTLSLSEEKGPRGPLVIVGDRILWQAGGWIVAVQRTSGKLDWYAPAIEDGGAPPEVAIVGLGKTAVALIDAAGRARFARSQTGVILDRQQWPKKSRAWVVGEELLVSADRAHYRLFDQRGTQRSELQLEQHRQTIAGKWKGGALPAALTAEPSELGEELIFWTPVPLRFDRSLSYLGTLEAAQGLRHDAFLAAVPARKPLQWMLLARGLAQLDTRALKVRKRLPLPHDLGAVYESEQRGVVAIGTAKGCYLFAPAEFPDPIHLPIQADDIEAYARGWLLAISDKVPLAYQLDKKTGATLRWSGKQAIPGDGAIERGRYLFARDAALFAVDLETGTQTRIATRQPVDWITRINGRLVAYGAGTLRSLTVSGKRTRIRWRCKLPANVATVGADDLDASRPDRWYLRVGDRRLIELLVK